MLFIRTVNTVLTVALVCVVSIGSTLVLRVPNAQAFPEGFNPSLIIDDDTFYNAYSMDEATVQAFLNEQVPVCNTWSHEGPPSPCLKDFRDSGVPTIGADQYCSNVDGGDLSAADIIVRVARACGINPQVIIVTLQKEQSLITDDWPRDHWNGNYQYQSAMGYGCPDSAPCDNDFAGFFNQVYYATRQFQKYRMSPTSFNFQAGTVRVIDGAMTFIANQATAALYNYTPHFHGNENFFIYMTKWFPTIPRCYATNGLAMYRLYNPNTGEHFYTSYVFEADNIVREGWVSEGCGWTAPISGNSVYRLYNPIAGDHHYTVESAERDFLVDNGWSYEGVGWRSGGSTPLFRQYNPFADTGTHNYTTDWNERSFLLSIGWFDEQVAWYGL